MGGRRGERRDVRSISVDRCRIGVNDRHTVGPIQIEGDRARCVVTPRERRRVRRDWQGGIRERHVRWVDRRAQEQIGRGDHDRFIPIGAGHAVVVAVAAVGDDPLVGAGHRPGRGERVACGRGVGPVPADSDHLGIDGGHATGSVEIEGDRPGLLEPPESVAESVKIGGLPLESVTRLELGFV